MTDLNKRWPWRTGLVVFTMMTLAACGGSSDDDNDEDSAAPPPPPARGDLVQPITLVKSLSVADFIAALGVDDVRVRIAQLAGTPKCRVDVHQVQYHTVGATNEATTASGALMVPAGTEPECTGARPVVVYAHGTSAERSYNIADVDNADNLEGILLAALFAANGYIVVAPNYAGYDTSSLPYHPYLNADQSSKDMIDALTAARSAIPTTQAPTTTAGTKLFITGYSQGGHVAMATHRALQAAGQTVTASAPMSGPYAMSAFGDAVFYGNVLASAPLLLTFTINSYERAYGNIYNVATDVFEARYANGIETVLPSSIPRNEVYTTGRLPRDQLFSATPPAPEFASITPPTTPAEFASLYAAGFGPDHLLTNAYRLAYLQDAQAQPDGGYPNTTNNQPPAAPANALRQAFKTNDLRNWTPTAPMLLCGGNADPTVFFFNTQLMQGYWANTAAPLTVLDVDSPVASNDPYEDYKDRFDAVKALVQAAAIAQGEDPEVALRENYHAGLVGPFCIAAARSFFDAR